MDFFIDLVSLQLPETNFGGRYEHRSAHNLATFSGVNIRLCPIRITDPVFKLMAFPGKQVTLLACGVFLLQSMLQLVLNKENKNQRINIMSFFVNFYVKVTVNAFFLPSQTAPTYASHSGSTTSTGCEMTLQAVALFLCQTTQQKDVEFSRAQDIQYHLCMIHVLSQNVGLYPTRCPQYRPINSFSR